MKFIEDLELEGKKVFLRVDFNVPMSDGEVSDDTRIKAGLESINYIIEKKGVAVVASHLGRPKSFEDKQFSMKPVGKRLAELSGKEVTTLEDCIGEEVKSAIDNAGPGSIIMLENLRFYPEEKKDDADFAAKLASLCDIYVNNAFAVCHRKNASVSKIVEFSKEAAAGHLLKAEIDNYNNAVNNPKRPLAAVIGGAKVSSKLNALNNIMNKVDKVIIGGAMANTFFAAKGYDVKKSLYEKDMIDSCLEVIEKASKNNVELYIPVDALAASDMKEDADKVFCPADEIPDNHMVLDIGPKTCEIYKNALKDCNTIVWNGPMGVFEMEVFSHGTRDIAEFIASCEAFTITGGGDTDAAIHKFGLEDKIDYISTGGGAFLTLMEGKPLPAVEALINK